MSCTEKNIDRSGYVLCPECEKGKFTFQDIPKNRIYFDSCPVCHQMMSIGFDDYMPFVKLMGEGITIVPESKKCEEKCACLNAGRISVSCPCKCHLPLTEEKPVEYRACEKCSKPFPCSFEFQGTPICFDCFECNKPLTETHTVEPSFDTLCESPNNTEKAKRILKYEEPKPECEHDEKTICVKCATEIPSEPDYYTKEEINSQMQLLYDAMKSIPNAKNAINDFMKEKLEFKRAFPFF